MILDTEALLEASQHFAEMFARNADMFDTTMQSLSCSEAEALADILRICGYEGEAALLIEAHTETDEPGDFHIEDDEEGDL